MWRCEDIDAVNPLCTETASGISYSVHHQIFLPEALRKETIIDMIIHVHKKNNLIPSSFPRQ